MFSYIKVLYYKNVQSLCLAHLSEDRLEQKYVQEAFDTNWVVPMGPNVTAFEEDLRKFVTGNVESAVYQKSR